MKNPMKRLVLPVVLAVVLAMAAVILLRKELDVVGRQSVTSFDAVLAAAADRVTPDDMNGGWSLAAPDGSARFIWRKDYSKRPMHDVMMELDAQPFLDAGLDAGKLPDSLAFNDGKLTVGTKLGEEAVKYSGEITPLASYEVIVSKYRDSVSYHAALDHFNVNAGGGNLFEWAKDMGSNDKDIVFVLDPAPFIAAGVDPGAVAGWVLAKVAVDVDGRPTEADKFLKPFDLK